MKFHSIYNQNPPEPLIEPYECSPEEHLMDLIYEHNDEESYENRHIVFFDYIEDLYFKELIKNEPKCIV